MAIHAASEEGILENVWSKIMSNDGGAAESPNSWEEVPNHDRT